MRMDCVRCKRMPGVNLHRIGAQTYGLCNSCVKKVSALDSRERAIDTTVRGLARLSGPVAQLIGRRA